MLKTVSAVVVTIAVASSSVSAQPNGAAYAQWQCIGDIFTPVRRFWSSDVECASSNSKDCLWQPNLAACNDVIKNMKLNVQPTGIRPLRCGNNHKAVWGGTGYGDGNHWCNKGYNLLNEYPAKTPWTCIDGINVPLRVNYWGDVECMAPNRRDCYWKNNQNECKALIANPPKPEVPLTCGEGHLNEYGGDGYSTSDHWCRRGANYFGLTK